MRVYSSDVVLIVEGLYGIGDVVTDLHQIAVAFGHAAVAACHVHHSLPMRYAEPSG